MVWLDPRINAGVEPFRGWYLDEGANIREEPVDERIDENVQIGIVPVVEDAQSGIAAVVAVADIDDVAVGQMVEAVAIVMAFVAAVLVVVALVVFENFVLIAKRHPN